MLEEILKKETVNEQDIKILNANIHLLSYEDKVRFGFEIEKEESFIGIEMPIEEGDQDLEEKPKRKKTAKRVPLN